MYKIICTFFVIFIASNLKAQYKNDNVLYKNVYAEDLSKELETNPGYLLLDVRSKGENEDTSTMPGMNIGCLKNAKNIDVRQLALKLDEIKDYKNAPVFVYCSHSQRSRRASKMLADSGFTKVFNINGGMTTLLQTNTDLTGFYETKENYRLVSPADFCMEANKKDIFLIDVRSDSSYSGISNDEEVNAMGRLQNAVHIPPGKLENSLSKIPKNKRIIIADEYGDESAATAKLLYEKGYKDVGILFNGLYNFINTNSADLSCKKVTWQPNKKYHILSPEEFDKLANQKDVVIIDIRDSSEFSNQSKDNWRNSGHIKNAKNIPASQFLNTANDVLPFANKPVVLYSLYSSGDAYDAAALLVNKGFTNVNILGGGIFNLRWRAANIKGKSSLRKWVTDIPADNL